MNSTVKYGLIAGAVSSIILVVMHYAAFELSQGFSVALIFGIILPIIFMVMGVKDERASQEGFISFGEALKTSFLIFFIAAIITSLVSFGLMQTYSEETWQSMADIQRENAKGMLEMFGMDDLQMEEALEEFTVEKIKEQTAGIGAVIINLLGNAFFGLIISLIVSAIMKRNPTP